MHLEKRSADLFGVIDPLLDNTTVHQMRTMLNYKIS